MQVRARALMFSGLEVMASIGFHAHEKNSTATGCGLM